MLCSQCHRPLVQDEDGTLLCCATTSLRWRCSQCAEVDEGFALPYGRCPHCGGQLLALDARHADAAAALHGIRTAFEIELGGRAFYQHAAAASTDPSMRALFSHFALMEGQHMEALARRYQVDVPAASPAFRLESAAVFAGVEHRPQDPENLFRVAIALEQRAADWFADGAAKAAPGSEASQLYRELAAEEREHADRLRAEYFRWRAARSGLHVANPAHAAPRLAAAAAPQINAAALLLAGHDGQRIALRCGAETLSYGALRDSMARAASVWRARGVGMGDRVAIKLPDGLDWVSAFLGAVWAGGVAVAVNPRIPPAEWQYILDEAGFSAIVAEASDDTPAPWRERVLLLNEWQSALAQAAPMPAQPMDPDAPAFWCHSSGTSGQPKAVVHAQRCVRRIEQVSRDALGITPDDRLFASSKLFFAYPQTNSLFAGLKLGASVVLDPQWPTAQSVAASVEAQHPSVLFSVPSLYRALLHEGLAPRIARAGVRLCVSAGEALPANLRDAWREQTGLAIINGYGASETLVLVMIDRGDERGFTPSPGIEIAPQGEPGKQGDCAPTRLCFHAPTLALGYLDRPQAQAEVFRDGGFCPADLFERSSGGGGWRFAGREDSLVKISGRWVNLVDLEQRLAAACPGIVESAAVCVPDDDGVDSVALFFVSADGAEAGAATAALRACVDRLPHHQQPRWLHAIVTLPRTPTGKLQRRKLAELHRTLA